MKKNQYNLIIFGILGNLSKKKILPSLYNLEKKKKLPEDLKIIGTGRSNLTQKEFIHIIKKSIQELKKEKFCEIIWESFKKRLYFCFLNINDINEFLKLKNVILSKDIINIYYLAVPPQIFSKICKGLGSYKLNTKESRIILEKPIGTSLVSYEKINNIFLLYFKEIQIFRIDHYLGKETILNLIALRFSNPILINSWKKEFIDHVQITVSEDIGIESRWEYYDNIGQTRDMVQSHILQILSIITMNLPRSLDYKDISLEKIKILKNIRSINHTNLTNMVSLGQYNNNTINKKYIASYLEEKGSNKNSITETFIALKVYIDNKKWENVPFYIRTGKRMTKKCSKIDIFFKNSINNIFIKNEGKELQNILTIYIQPNESISINLFNKKPNITSNYILIKTSLSFSYSDIFKKNVIIDAYERLLLESIKGKKILFIHHDEVKESWKWIDPIIQAFHSNPRILQKYPSGTWGPMSSKLLIESDGRFWKNN